MLVFGTRNRTLRTQECSGGEAERNDDREPEGRYRSHGLGIIGTGPPKESAAERAAIFGDHTTFSAVARMPEKDVAASAPRTRASCVHGGPWHSKHGVFGSRELRYYFAGGKLRLEEDAAKNSQFSPEAIQERRLKGTDRYVWIVDPARQTTMLLFPALSGYVELGAPEQGASAEPKIEKLKVGEEKVEGHPCARYRIVATEQAGPIEIATWEAADERRFPVQVQVLHGDVTITVQFTNVKFAKPPASLFEVPAGYRRYKTVQELMEASAHRQAK